jgi:serine/threonine-protein kinase PknG
MTTPATCQEPGCTGSILDGYCDVCGTPAAASGAPAAAAPAPTPGGPPAPPPRPAACRGADHARTDPSRSSCPTATPCAQPGCTGTILDGYCDVCGSAADQPPAGTESADELPDRLHPLAASNRLSATVIGLGTGAADRLQDHPTAVLLVAADAGGPARGRAHVVPPLPAIDASAAVMKDPVVPEDKRFCSNVRHQGRAQHRRSAGAHDRLLPQVPAGVLLRPQAQARRSRGRAVRSGRLPRPRRSGLDLPRPRPQCLRTAGSCSRACSTPATPTRWPRRSPSSASSPRSSTRTSSRSTTSSPRGCRLHRHGVRRGHLAQGPAQAADAQGRALRPLPVDQALAYIIEILPAFQYLHDLGLVYCDFKPDNLIQVGDDIKLIDLGGVRRIDDDDSAIFGTVGYQAPEVAEQGVSVASDIYTIGRTLVVLTMEFKGYQTTYVDSLPPVEETPSSSTTTRSTGCCSRLRDLTRRPVRLADEMRVQMLGVLREVVPRTPRRHPGRHVGGVGALRGAGDRDRPAGLVVPARLRPDPHDRQASLIREVRAMRPHERLDALRAADPCHARRALELARVGSNAATSAWSTATNG